MGVVWEARHLALETDVAVKLIRPDRAAVDPALGARFEREARATARIAHPHVVQVMDYGVLDGAVPYLVMELLRGASLAELLARGGRLSLATTILLVEQVGSALESAHERGIVHRDIKPHNVFITEGGRGYPLFVKVLDFGVAKTLGDTQVPGGSPALTETGTVIGSPPYMSPEQLEGSKDVDLRSDLWSLAVITYETLTGALPFQGASFVSVGAAVLKGRYRPASELAPNLPASIDDWFAKALSVDREARFRSAREMVEAFLEQAGPPSERDPSPDEARLSAPATTMPAAPAIPEPGATADHAPLAQRPAELPAPLAPPGTPKAPRLRRILAAGTLAAMGATGVGLAWPARPLTCPSGMALIDGATFPMGSAGDGETPSDETPIHPVAVRAFCLDVTEVTVGAYTQCADCGPLPSKVELEGVTPNGRAFESQFCNPAEARAHPVNCVDWHQAKTYCKAQGRRLPT
jgi:serine/threonine-protein kinase